MKKILTFFLTLVLLGCGNLNAQTGDLLYGVTSAGGADGQGVIFHVDPATGTQTIDYSLPLVNKGKTPYGDLAEGENRKFYGVTSRGGENNMGIIFEWDPFSNVFTKKIDFDGSLKGSSPCGALVLCDGKFYGMATFGGASGKGVIFEWDPVFNTFTKKIDFDGIAKGKYPFGTLSLKGGKLYGMSRYGGTYDKGVIFEWDPSNNIFTKKVDFDGTDKGDTPSNGCLTERNGKFYGMTWGGGEHGHGVIFEWDPADNTFIKKIDFNGESKGSSPFGSLTLFEEKFYGMTYRGGEYNAGVIFEWDPSDNTFIKKADFEYNSDKGCNPVGSLTLSNGKFYGLTSEGGARFRGVIFEWDPVNNLYAKKKDFIGSSTGSHPSGSLKLSGGKLYGMTSDMEEGYAIGCGVIFELEPFSNTFAKKVDFNHALDGCKPFGSLTYSNGKFYGLTSEGGAYGNGVLFEWDPANNIYSRKVNFEGSEHGSNPTGSLTLFNGKFYGMTSAGGFGYGYGIIFEWDPNTNIFTKKIDFDNTDKGSFPFGSLTLNDGKFYGMTNSGGANLKGILFEWDPASNIFIKKIDFDGAEHGSNPHGSLILSEGKFYGMTGNGGRTDSGILFEWDPATNIFTVKKDFDDNASGLYPRGTLALRQEKFYGMTTNGGTTGCGILFEWDPATNNFTKKIDFESTSTGWYPEGALTFTDGKFYGMTNYGGANYRGVIFGWDPENNSITKLLDFDGTNGGDPVYTSFAVYNNTVTIATWSGTVNNDWFNDSNWNPARPQPNTEVYIPHVTSSYPTLTSPATCASITIESGASFIGAEYLTVGTATVKQDIVNTEYHFLSSPVIGNTFGNVFSGSMTTWSKKWNPLTNAWNWLTSLNQFDVGAGYAVTTSTPTVTANFVGQLNKEEVSCTLSNANGGWNLLGNPFQSAIDWNSVIPGEGVSASVAVWTGSNYLYWNGTVGFGGIIPPQNGFFVSTIIDEATLSVPLAARVHSNITLYRESVANALEIQADGNNASDHVFVHFNNEATATFDNMFDARKLFGEGYAPQLYSIIMNDVLAINELPMAGNEVVELGFSCNADGNYSFTAKGMESFDAKIPIFLEDTKMNFMQNLRDNPVYNFSYVADENVNRFKLHFESSTGIMDLAENGISIYSYDHDIIINNTTSFGGEVHVYDMAGRLLIETNLGRQMKASIPVQTKPGNYMVKVVTTKVNKNQVVFIR